MNELIRILEQLRGKLEGLRRRSLKETPTRTILIDPIFEALGWDVRDPDEVELEYPTVDGKSVDYALKINRRPVLLVEAKALGDPLDDVKAVTQVVGYAANDGIAWCALTNGVLWRVYKSDERCPAPEKLMYEVSIDPHDSADTGLQDAAARLWRFSKGEMAKGTLDELGEQTFTDAKVRKVLETVMRDAPRALVNIVRKLLRDDALTPKTVKASLARVWSKAALVDDSSPPPGAVTRLGARGKQTRMSAKEEGPKGRGRLYDEGHHTTGKPQEVLELYRAIDRFCLSLSPGDVQKRYQAKYIAYRCHKHIFCCVHLLQSRLRVWLKLKYSRLDNPPAFVRDVSGVGHWGPGDVELAIRDLSLVNDAALLIRQSFDAVASL